MPDPITVGALVAAALAAGAAEAGKAVLGQAARDAYDRLKSAAGHVLGPAVGMLEGRPDSADLTAGVAAEVDRQPEGVQAELRPSPRRSAPRSTPRDGARASTTASR